MKLARTLGVTAILFGSLTLIGSPRAFACDPNMGCDSSGSSSSGDSSTSGNNSSDSGSSDSSGSSEGCSSGCGGHEQPKTRHVDPDPPEEFVVPAQPSRPGPPVRSAPVAPAAPVDPGGDFVPATPPPAPVLEQDAVSRGASTPDPARVPSSSDPGSDHSSPPLGLIIPALAVAAAGAGLTFAPARPRALPAPASPVGPPPPLPPPLPASPPAPVGVIEGSDFSGGDGIHTWHIWTDNRGNFTLAEQPSGDFFTVADGPFFTFAAGAAAMANLGIPGWS